MSHGHDREVNVKKLAQEVRSNLAVAVLVLALIPLTGFYID